MKQSFVKHCGVAFLLDIAELKTNKNDVWLKDNVW